MNIVARISRLLARPTDTTVTSEPLKTATPPPSSCFDFFGLPPELRDHVYSYLLPCGGFTHQKRCTRCRDVSGMWLANKQINREYMDVLRKKSSYWLYFAPCAVASCPRCCRNRDTVTLMPARTAAFRVANTARLGAPVIVHTNDDEPFDIAPCQLDALRSFRRICLRWRIGESDIWATVYPDNGFAALPRFARLVGSALRDTAVEHREHDVRVALKWEFYDLRRRWTGVAASVKAGENRLDRWVLMLEAEQLEVEVRIRRASSGRGDFLNLESVVVLKPK